MKKFTLYLRKYFFVFLLSLTSFSYVNATESVANEWVEAFLAGIRKDFGKPTVQARNLFHMSIAMYDAWAILNPGVEETYLLGKTIHGHTCDFGGITPPVDVKAAQEEAISYAVYTLMRHRFIDAPGVAIIFTNIDNLMNTLGYDISFTSTDYSTGSYAALGNYIGQSVIDYGLQDGSNESHVYANQYYTPVNPPLAPVITGNTTIIDPNHWQPLTLSIFIDQNGNVIPLNVPPFLTPEWGNVSPFSLQDDQKTVYTNNLGEHYNVFYDPGTPPFITDVDTRGDYIWSFALDAVWSSHLDPSDGVMIDISPNSVGNNPALPTTFAGQRDFYNLIDGGDQSQGYTVNPKTGLPYEPQMVLRGDFTRVLAEFWADGPNSETPPGHWFTILNYVLNRPEFVRKFEGVGDVLDTLEFDVKAYFALGGAMHDAAITCWGIKGWYDFIRPISAIRYMGSKGQSTDNTLSNYDVRGLPLIPGYIEIVMAGDSLEGDTGQNVGKIKMRTWNGPSHIVAPATDVAGVGWILSGDWWPYQRPTFVTPPFAGWISGHSTYSRTAAEVMTLITGDPYFPGGMGEFFAAKDAFLVFEDGPSEDVTLQWATYTDASDQCSLSRIWGGIHPPCDDIPGRLIGKQLGPAAFNFAKSYFEGVSATNSITYEPLDIYPNPSNSGELIDITLPIKTGEVTVQMMNSAGQVIYQNVELGNNGIKVPTANIASGMYVIRAIDTNNKIYQSSIVIL